LDGHAGARTIHAQRREHGGAAPVSVGTAGMEPLSPARPPAQARHVGPCPGFIDKDELLRIPSALPPAPLPSFFGYVRPALFAGMERLFLYVSPMPAST